MVAILSIYCANFNSHPPAEGDSVFNRCVEHTYNFNSHPPAEGDCDIIETPFAFS